MWRVPAVPIGAHTVLSLLAEPLKQPTEILLSTEDPDVSENLREFQDWVCLTLSLAVIEKIITSIADSFYCFL